MKKYLFLFSSLFFLIFATILNAGSARDYEITIDSVEVNEDVGNATISIRIDPKISDNNEQIVVSYTTSDDSAIAPGDYTSTTASKTFQKNDTDQSITIPIQNDSIPESQEIFNVTLTGATFQNKDNPNSTVTVITNTGGEVTINDDDGSTVIPTISVTNVTVNENASNATFTITRSESAASSVSFSYSTGPLTATQDQDYTFTAGTGSLTGTSTTIDVPIIDDNIAGEGDETFSFIISNPSVGTGLGNAVATGTIVDDDTALSLAINDASIAEGDTDIVATVKVLFSEAITSPVTFTYETKDGNSTTIDNATSTDDYTAIAASTVTVPAGTSEYDLNVTITGDTTGEGAEEFYLLISNVTSSETIVVADDLGKITIFDNDNNGGCSTYTGLMTINEYQNNPNYKDATHPLANNAGKVPGNYVEIKYIDFLIKQYVNDLWAVSIYTTSGADSLTWDEKDPECTDPRYEIFEMDNKVMGKEGYVVLTDANGNEVDVLRISGSNHYNPGCTNFPYDTDFEASAQNKDLFRVPDGTGTWYDHGSGANSGGSRCINRDGAGVLFTEFEAIDPDEPLPASFTGLPSQTPIKTKVVNKAFDMNILWLNLGSSPITLKTTGLLNINVYLGYIDSSGLPQKLPNAVNTAKYIQFNNDGQKLVSVSNPTFIYDNAIKEARIYFEYCQDENSTVYSIETCADTTNYSYGTSISRNIFAIRPDRLDIGLTDTNAPNLLRAGEDYDISLKAQNYGEDNNTVGYTITTNYSLMLETNTTRYFRNGIEDTTTPNLLAGIYDVNTSVTSYMINGFSSTSTTQPGSAQEVIKVSYSDVGKATLRVIDPLWAEVDNDDTPMNCDENGTFVCGDENLTFIPHHFGFAELNITNHAGPDNSEFTYVADRRGMPPVSTAPLRSMMAARVQTRIEALNKDGAVTENFREDDGANLYYENPISLTLDVEVPTIGTANGYLYPDANESNITTQLIGFGRAGESEDNGTRNIEWDESTYPLDFNFQREINEFSNPFVVNGSYLAIKVISTYTDASTPSSPQDVNGSRIGDYLATSDPTRWADCATNDGCESSNADDNATFYFGRARPAQYFYKDITTDSANTPVTATIYCRDTAVVNCNDFRFNTVLDGIDEAAWYLSMDHNASRGDGNVTIIIGSPLIEPVSPVTAATDQAVEVAGASYTFTSGNAGNVMILANGVRNDVNVSRGTNPTPPLTVPVELVQDGDTAAPPYTNEWLIYNAFTPAPSSPFYKVRFIGESSWTGVNTTGYVSDKNASYKKTNRADW